MEQQLPISGKEQYRPLKDCFKPSEKVTAQHILYRQFYEGERKDGNKLIFYLCMWEAFGQPREKDEHGNLGYKLEFIPKHEN